MKGVSIVAAGRRVDGIGDLSESYRVEEDLAHRGIDAVELVIDPLKAGWSTPQEQRHYRSGCGPLEALAAARSLIASGQSSLVVISGEDLLRTGYSREERHRLMAIYGEYHLLPQAYTDLAVAFMGKFGISEGDFRVLTELLFENYVRAARRRGDVTSPEERWFRPVTSLFRGVDCANPVVDFTGRLVLCSDEAADACGLPARQRIAVAGVGLRELPGDGPRFIGEIANFMHLKEAFQKACSEAELDIASLFLNGKVLLEAYTCYPVVPIAFLLASRIAESLAAIPEILRQHNITVTGGMNLARAAWNNPCLNALVAMYEELVAGPLILGAVHGNGGLGYKQGVALLARRS